MSRTWLEWGVRRLRGDVGSVANFVDRETAEAVAKAWGGELVSRVVTSGEWTTVECGGITTSEETK